MILKAVSVVNFQLLNYQCFLQKLNKNNHHFIVKNNSINKFYYISLNRITHNIMMTNNTEAILSCHPQFYNSKQNI